MTSLTQVAREEIARKVASAAFKSKQEAKQAALITLSLAFYRAHITEEDEEAARKVGGAWVQMTDSYDIYVKDQDGPSYTNRIRLRFERDMPIRRDGMGAPLTPAAGRHAHEAALKFKKSWDALDEEEEVMRKEMMAVLRGFKTVEKLQAALPEIAEHLPEYLKNPVPGGALMAVADIEKVRLCLKKIAKAIPAPVAVAA